MQPCHRLPDVTSAIPSAVRATDDRQRKARLPPTSSASSAWSPAVASLRTQVAQRIVGQDAVVDGILTAILAGGHALLIGVPGLAKTLMVQTRGRGAPPRASTGSSSPPT